MTDTSREAFEKWCIEDGHDYDFRKSTKDEYEFADCYGAFAAWQASRKALEADQAQAVEPVGYFLRDRAVPDDWRFHYTDPRPVRRDYEVQPLFFPRQVAVPATSAAVKRYEPELYDEDRVRMELDLDGEWVKYSDFLAQQVAVPAQCEPLSDEQIVDWMWGRDLNRLDAEQREKVFLLIRDVEAHHKIGVKT